MPTHAQPAVTPASTGRHGDCITLSDANTRSLMAKKLSNTTWVLGDTPCRTLKDSAGCWVDQTHDKQGRHGSGGKVGGTQRPRWQNKTTVRN